LKPISPVVPGFERYERVFGASQPEYIPLPTLATGDDAGVVISRWRMTWKERLRALVFGDVYLRQATFGQALQPVLVHIEAPRVEGVSDAEPGLRREARSVGSQPGASGVARDGKDSADPAANSSEESETAGNRILRPRGGDVLKYARTAREPEFGKFKAI